MPDIRWCFVIIWAIYVLNHRYNGLIDNLLNVARNNGNHELHTNSLFVFIWGSKVYIVTTVGIQKQLHAGP